MGKTKARGPELGVLQGYRSCQHSFSPGQGREGKAESLDRVRIKSSTTSHHKVMDLLAIGIRLEPKTET